MPRDQRITIYYDQDKDGDLKKAVAELSAAEVRFKGRSESDIAKMLLMEALAIQRTPSVSKSTGKRSRSTPAEQSVRVTGADKSNSRRRNHE